jgi:hypothetical protein
MKMEKYYWYKNCPACNQGRLIITQDITNERLYLHCEECEMGWLNPSDADENKNGFLTLLVDFETKNPDFELIQKNNWSPVAKYSFEE